MKVLMMTGPIWPTLGHNANLMAKLLSVLKQKHDVSILTYLPASSASMQAPSEFRGVPLYFATPKNNFRERLLYRAEAKLFDHYGYSDLITSKIYAQSAAKLLAEQRFDAILASTGPFVAMNAASMQSKVIPKYLYMMDPSEPLWGDTGTPYRNRNLRRILNRFDRIFTTKYAHEAFLAQGYTNLRCQFTELGFPMIETHDWEPLPDHIRMPHDKVNLLFCGTMSKALQRSPAYYLRLAEQLDNRFRLFFVGKGCDRVAEEFSFHTRAEVITLSQQPYSVALSMMHHADILINIGNRVRVHLPSKVLEYISICKPIVNFYKFDDCPSLDYTKRYPMCLDISENTALTPDLLESFIRFCLENQGKSVDFSFVNSEYSDCCPDYIARLISDSITAGD